MALMAVPTMIGTKGIGADNKNSRKIPRSKLKDIFLKDFFSPPWEVLNFVYCCLVCNELMDLDNGFDHDCVLPSNQARNLEGLGSKVKIIVC